MEITEVGTLEELQKALIDPEIIEIDITQTILIEKDTVIDFNGKTAVYNNSSGKSFVFMFVKPDIELTLKSSEKSGGITTERVDSVEFAKFAFEDLLSGRQVAAAKKRAEDNRKDHSVKFDEKIIALAGTEFENNTVTFEKGFYIDYSFYDTTLPIVNSSVKTFNLNGANIEGNFFISANTVNISGGEFLYIGKESEGGVIAIPDNGKFNMSGGKIDSFEKFVAVSMKNNVDANISGGVINSAFDAIEISGSHTNLKVSDTAQIIGQKTAVHVCSGSVSIDMNGGTIKNPTHKNIYTSDPDVVDEILKDIYSGKAPSYSTFVPEEIGTCIILEDSAEANIKISGGNVEATGNAIEINGSHTNLKISGNTKINARKTAVVVNEKSENVGIKIIGGNIIGYINCKNSDEESYINISGGIISGEINSKCPVNISGGAITAFAAVTATGSNAFVSVSGGNLLGSNSCIYLKDGAKGIITGGTFSGEYAVALTDSESGLIDEVTGAIFKTKKDYLLGSNAKLINNSTPPPNLKMNILSIQRF